MADRASSDGRVLRGHRNRERILSALRDLVQSGVVRPSAQQVAERAGVGERSVYRHFADMEQLRMELGDRMLAEVRKIIEPGPPTAGPLPDRIHSLVRWRARLYERIAPFRRSGSLDRFHSRVVQKHHARLATMLRTQLAGVFGAELAGAGPARREALDAMCSYETWERLRKVQGLDAGRAIRAVETAIAAILPPEVALRRRSRARPTRRASSAGGSD